jgi:hypothetical protein
MSCRRVVLERAVFDAYGLPADASEDAILAHLLALNAERAGLGCALGRTAR